jgi:hypothetical protein
LVVEDWFTPDVWLEFDVALLIVLLWLAETPLFTDWLPLPTCTPGLMFAPAFTELLEMFAFASTPTFGFTFRLGLVLDVEELEVDGLVVLLDWPTEEPCVLLEVAPVVFADWFALTPLVTDWLPLPIFTPGLMFAPRFTSVLLMFAFASTPTFGFTLSDGLNDVPLELVLGVVLELVLGEVLLELVPGDVLDGLPIVLLEVEAEPLSAPLEVEAEPLIELLWFELAVPMSFVGLAELVMPLELVLPLAVLPVPRLVESWMQSWWTGLAECSRASPVSLLASLPALGLLKLLHGWSAEEPARLSRSPRLPWRSRSPWSDPRSDDCMLLPCLPEWLELSSANAGAAPRAPITATARILRVSWTRFICSSSCGLSGSGLDSGATRGS